MVVICASAFYSINCQAQNTYLNILQAEDDMAAPISTDNYPIYIDSIMIERHIDSLTSAWIDEGYINATYDSITYSGNSATAYIYKGYKYDQLNLLLDTKTSNLLQEAGMQRTQWIEKSYNHQKVRDGMDKIITYLENNGYPFARVKLDSVDIDKGTISAKLIVNKNDLVLYDTLNLTGNANVTRKFLHRYLEIKPGEPYILNKILAIKQKVTSLPYCKLASDPVITFVNGKALLNLALEKQQASTFDFIIGVLPNNQNGQRDLTITGEFNGDLYNELGYGERIYAKFERLRPETQELELKFNMPYLINFPFGIDTDFGLYRNSTDFLDLRAKFGLQYLFSGINYIDASWYFNSSRLIEIDTAALVNTLRLPTELDVNYTGGGVGISIQEVDYRYNPSKGFRGSINTTVGIKTIVPNATIQSISEDGIDYSNAYDSLDLKTFQAEIHATASYFFPIGTWATIKSQIRSSYKYNQVQLYDNELFRIGGNKLLRGFDEQSILTDLYAVATAEFRVVLDRNSFLSFPFIDFGRVRSLQSGELKWENTLGAGIGLNFATGAGIFNVSFAIGKRNDIPVDFNATKIHFGYVSLF